jgi:hypothetical protein
MVLVLFAPTTKTTVNTRLRRAHADTRGSESAMLLLNKLLNLCNVHLEVLQWARANGCDWDKGTCEYAEHRGRLGVLQWARDNHCREDT